LLVVFFGFWGLIGGVRGKYHLALGVLGKIPGFQFQDHAVDVVAVKQADVEFFAALEAKAMINAWMACYNHCFVAQSFGSF
jgi:hypothetical protein